jgi:hypothetical protein
MTKEELARLELQTLDAWIARARRDLARLEAKKANFKMWEPTAAKRNAEGVLEIDIHDPFAEDGHARGTPYERIFDFGSVAATELGEPVIIVWHHDGVAWEPTRFLANPGETPKQIRKTQDTPLGRWINGDP